MTMKKKLMTLAVLYNTENVLLAMKKRGFGAGRWNGYGGKVQEGESVKEAMSRELTEEAGIPAPVLTEAGLITFVFPEKKEELAVHLFRSADFHGQAVETEEMRPQWFARDQIPFAAMWPDDPIWMPLFLAGKDIAATFWFKDENTIMRYELRDGGRATGEIV